MRSELLLAFVLAGLSGALAAAASPPSMEEIYENRKIPAWFNEAKFGIFVVWGPYSVPAYRDRGYAEWYWKDTERHPPSKEFHERVYGKDFPYEKFAEQFTAELWDPDFWCDLFQQSGAKYVVTTANYHDGFALWPTEYSATRSTTRWNAKVTGPKRDILGELNEAGNKRGLKMDIYYSLYEWYHPLWLADRERFATEWLHPKFKEVVNKYKPWHIFLDGDWDMSWEKWRTNELARWLYTESPVKDTVVVNDRWGGSRGRWGDVFESEYGGGQYTSPQHPWQEDRGIGRSYGYNRAESVYDYDSREQLLRMFSRVVGGGGNFLLSVRPTGDGRIPVIMQERLLQVGAWLKVNGEAVYSTTASPFWPRHFDWGTVSASPGHLYFHVHDPDRDRLSIAGISAQVKSANLLHQRGRMPVSFTRQGDTLSLAWPAHLNDTAVTVIALDVDEGYTVDRTPRQYENGTIDFNCRAMTIHGRNAEIRYTGFENRLTVEKWSDVREYLSAEFVVEQPGTYEVVLICSSPLEREKANAGGRFTLQVGDTGQILKVPDVGRDRKPGEMKAGTIQLAAGRQNLSIKPVDDGNWKGFLFQGIRFKRVGSTR